MERPTKKQRELLLFIDGFVKGNGYGPSYREIMRALDYRSVSTVATHVDGLIARGWLRKKDNSARSLEVVSLQTQTSLVQHPKQDDLQRAKNKIQELIKQFQDQPDKQSDVEVLQRTLELLDETSPSKKSA